ncbi:alpha/beta hydrolase [Microbacterium sp. bgisy203]|uniref:alpha/beta hydrolase n=1 Tax=Microbacterium sp. bgisy203 TaxID=3413799 RepID=UPI003D762620
MAEATERTYTDARGVEIVFDHYAAATEPRAVVQLLHGIGEHARRYGNLIDALTADGYVVYADDHRGHGRTGERQHGGDPDKIGHLGVGGLRATVDALWQFTQLIRAENPDLPLIILGHSWGSFMTQRLFDKHTDSYDAVVLSGSAYRMLGYMNVGNLNKRWESKTSNGTEWMASDPAVGEAFLADPYGTTEPMQRLFSLPDQMRILGRPARDIRPQRPVLLMVGEDDSLGGPRSINKLADVYRTRSGLDDVTVIVYPGARHEIFNEPIQGDVRDDLLAWLDKRIPVRD